jgi:hypothetical protein
MPGRNKRKPSLVEILIIMAIIGILLSIIGGKRPPVRRMRDAARPPAAVSQEPGRQAHPYFWRP